MRTEAEPAKAEPVNAFDVPTFCRRNSISVTTAYRLKREGKLTIDKLFDKALVSVEAEAAFRKLLREGKLASFVRRRGKRAKAASELQAATT
jgi:hypothetical protein